MLQALDVFDDCRKVHLNDSAGAIYTDDVLLPYLNTALEELQDVFEEHNVGYTNEILTDIPFSAGTTILDFTNGLPLNFHEVRNLYERITGTGNEYQPMKRRDFLPSWTEEERTSFLTFFTWNSQQIETIGSNSDEQLKLEYIARRVARCINRASVIDVIGSRLFLGYRSSGLASEYIGENVERAASLNDNAIARMETLLNINLKGQQAITTRRRPFRAGFKARQSNWYR